MTPPLEPGSIRLRGVSRKFRIVHDRSATLKETLIRRSRATYTELWALRDIDLDIHPGEAVALIGRNGSGKSTLLKILAGIIPPQVGTIESAGSVASMLELGAGFHPDFTGRENVFMNGAIHGLTEKEIRRRLPEIIAFAELEDFIDMPVRTYSSGMQMRLAFAVAAHVDPDILLLDEVLAVGDEAFQRKCMGRIYDFLAGGGTLVFVSHDPNAVERICDRAILIDRGRVARDGRPPEVLEEYHRLLADESAVAADDEPDATESDDEPDEGVDHEGVAEASDLGTAGGWGTGEVLITGCRLLGPSGPTDGLLSGDPATIEIRLHAAGTVATPSIGISIRTGDGIVCFGTNTHMSEFELDEITGDALVRVVIPALNLQEGRFDVTVAAHSRDERHVFHWLDQALSFSVFPRSRGVGIAALDPHWELVPIDEQATA